MRHRCAPNVGKGMSDHTMLNTLRGRGYRVTPQRVLIREILEHSAGHLSAQDVHAAVQRRFPGVDLSTVYRVLELFVRLGLVAKRDFGEGRAVYEWCPEHATHHHMVCAQCGAVAHFASEHVAALVEEACAAVDFVPRAIELTVIGECRQCRSAEAV